MYGKGLPYDEEHDWYELYLAAKRHGGSKAAHEVVTRCMSLGLIDILAGIVAKIVALRHPPPLLVFPLSVELQADSIQSRVGN